MKEQGKRWAMSQLQDPAFEIKATRYGKLEATLSARTPDGERISHEMRPTDALIDCELRLERTKERNPDMTSEQITSFALRQWWWELQSWG